MYRYIHRGFRTGSLLLLGLGASALPGPQSVEAQEPARESAREREIVFNQVTVSGEEAGLVVEFDDGEELSVSFRDERVLIDGEEAGRYDDGGPLEAAWRSFLARAVAAEGRELAELLEEWSPPAGLEDETAAAADALEARIAASLVTAPATPEDPPVSVHPEGDVQELVERLIFRTEHLRSLASAVRDLRTDDMRIHVGDAVRVDEGEVVTGSMLVLDGDLTIDGEVEGDVLVLGGRVALGDDARVGGDLRWTDAEVVGNRDAVRGRVLRVQPVADRPEATLRDEIREEVRGAMRSSRAPQRGFWDGSGSALRSIVGGIGSLLQTLVTFAVLFGIGLALLYFAPRNFEVVARTARHATGRSAVVGLAGTLLAFPVWIVGIVLLAVTIIGIPVMLLWLPLFPLAVVLAITFGYLAVARNLGRWASGRRFQGLDALDPSRPAVQLGGGLAVLLAAFALAAVFQMGGAWLSIFHGLLTFIGVLLAVSAGLVGLGAILLSRGGKDPLYAGPDWSYAGAADPWAPEPDPFEGEPPREGGHPGPGPTPGPAAGPGPEEGGAPDEGAGGGVSAPPEEPRGPGGPP